MLERIQALYQEYTEEYHRLERTRKIGAGMFGLGGGPKNDPCHEKFAKDLEGLLREAADTAPGQVKDILEFIWFTSPARPDGGDAASWMQLAVHSLTPPLVPLLDPEAASELLDRYEAAYPKRERFPAQKRVVSALKKRKL